MSLVENPPILKEIQDFLSEPEFFSSLDNHFGLFVGRLAKKYSLTTALAGALVSRTTGEGNICLDLKEYAGKPLPFNSRRQGMAAFVCPDLAAWTEQLLESGVASQNDGDTPLVLAGSGRLYLNRYRQYENSIISFIRHRANSTYRDHDYSSLHKDLKKLFETLPGKQTDWQQIAVISAVSRSFSVISGGPGTGKTSTVAKILALLISQNRNNSDLRILLAAPTGKAASRLQQAIAESGLVQTGSEPLQVATLHRMLGSVPNSPYFRHNAENPLVADIIVIDEASMVDLPLMAKLMQAVPASTRLILLGDRHQLASVQPGSVLADICPTEIMSSFSHDFQQHISELTDSSFEPDFTTEKTTTSCSLEDSFVELVHSYRFGPESSIAKLSKAVKNGDGDGAFDILLRSEDESTAWSDIPGPSELGKALQNSPMVEQFRAMQQAPDPDSCFSLLDNFRLLCGLRQGPFGVERVNYILEQLFAQQVSAGFTQLNPDLPACSKTSLLIRPVMVTRNDYNLQLFNGDVGIIMPDPAGRQSERVFFREKPGMLRNIALPLLPAHETVFAITVHKSQGSEFDRLVLILPDQDSPLLTRELLYTAITRAREKVEIWGRKKIFMAAVKRRIKRTSGLAEGLWGESN
jgi:exodeoxyribonuclease V alpha subunit